MIPTMALVMKARALGSEAFPGNARSVDDFRLQRQSQLGRYGKAERLIRSFVDSASITRTFEPLYT